ncbi:MAG: BlaI/MecI/CopY family transcriptional regulator [Planctomycetales bacterium]|nr:BlaI/MecI/CopY family transcriptional regulator [Planctomycetales bacterium]
MPNRRDGPTLTAAEAEVMNIVWDRSPVTVGDVVERLPRELAYTTVMTTIRILEEKGFLAKCGKRRQAYLYEATIDKSEVRGSMASEIANRLFNGSIKSLVLNLIHDNSIKAEDLAEVKRLIEELEKQK